MSRLLLGLDVDNQQKVYIHEHIRSTHMQVIGSTGTGKSKFLEWMIRKDIYDNKGLCLIDPHGYLYDDLINWLTSYQEYFKDKKIVLFNPASDDYFLGFNPFINHSLDISHQVDTMVNSCAKAWGAENMDSTPLLKKCLRCIFHALAEADLTLLESLFFISLSKNSKMLRTHLVEKIKNPIIKEIWQSFNALNKREYNEQFSSSANRLIEFLSSERIRRIIGQRKNTISFKKMMDQGYIVLVNLSSGQRLSKDNARLLGTLMINDLFLSATERKRTRTQPPKPFYLYIDECAQFLNEDIGRILDECRKFGLHLILAHQHLAQLRKAGEDIYSSVMTDAKTKVIFGGLTPDDAEILSKQIFMGEFDIDEVKKEIYSRKVVDYRLRWFSSKAKTIGASDTETEGEGEANTETEGESYSDTESKNWNVSDGDNRSRGRSEGTSYPASSPMSEDTIFSYSTNEQIATISSSSRGGSTAHSETQNRSISRTESKNLSKGHTESESYTEGMTEGPWAEWGTELSSVQFRRLDEQLYRAMAMMVNQPRAHCLIKIPEQTVRAVKVPRVKEDFAIYCSDMDLLKIYEEANFEKYKKEFIALKEQVDREINSRQVSLLKIVEEEKRKEKEQEEKDKGSIKDLRE